MLKTWVSLLSAVLLALSAALGFVAYRCAPIDIVRWFLPPGVVLSELSGLSVSSSGGSIDNVDVTLPEGQLVASSVDWQWQLQFSTSEPLRLTAVSLKEGSWISSAPSDVEVSTATKYLTLPDIRRQSWWPVVASAEFKLDRLSIRTAVTEMVLGMDQTASAAEGSISVLMAEDRFLLNWQQIDAVKWRGDAEIQSDEFIEADWSLEAIEVGFKLSVELQPQALPVAKSRLDVTVAPFEPREPALSLVTATMTSALQLPEPLQQRLLGVEVQAEIDTAGAGYLTATALRLESPVMAERLRAQVDVTWGAAFANPVASVRDGDVLLKDIDLGEQQVTRVESAFAGTWDLLAQSGELTTSQTTLEIVTAEGEAMVRSSGLSALADPAMQTLSGSLQVDGAWGDTVLPSVDALISVSLADSVVTGELSGFAPWGPLGDIRFQHLLSDQSLTYEAQVDSRLWDWSTVPSALAGAWPELNELEVASLAVVATAVGQWTPAGFTSEISGQLAEGYLSQGALGLAGLAVAPFELRIEGQQVRPVRPINFALDAINAGVQVTDLMGVLELDAEGWVLTRAEGRALGGQLLVDQFRDFSKDGPLGTVYLNDIDLAAVVDVAGTEGVTIQGRATAALPLVWQNGNILVDAGTLRGTPGSLQYQPSVDPSAIDQRVGAVAAALSNLQFEQLDADITLNEEGVMFFSTSVLGSNPDYQDGRQVKLNLTLENNLLSLLQSLQTIDSVNLWVTRKFEQQQSTRE